MSAEAVPSPDPAPFSFETSDLLETLEDLCARFILNLPPSELASIPRIYFQLEACWWFYEDFCRDANPKLPSYSLKQFAVILFDVCPTLSEWSDQAERTFLEFMRYKSRVPVCGAIMINETWDKCVLVKGWKGNSWSFPKGKINQEEPKHICAIREVLEETGYDLASLLNPKDYLEVTVQDQRITLYIVPGVPEDFPFKTQTRKEIGAISWFRLKDLPMWSKKKGDKGDNKTPSGGRFYMLTPFVQNLRKFVRQRKPSALDGNRAAAAAVEEDVAHPPASTSSPIIESLVVVAPEDLEREPQAPQSELDELFALFLNEKRVRADDPAAQQRSPSPPPTRSILDDLFTDLLVTPKTAATPPPVPALTRQPVAHASAPPPPLLPPPLPVAAKSPSQYPATAASLGPNPSLLALLNPQPSSSSPVFSPHAPRSFPDPAPAASNHRASLLATLSPNSKSSFPPTPVFPPTSQPPGSHLHPQPHVPVRSQAKEARQQALLQMLVASPPAPYHLAPLQPQSGTRGAAATYNAPPPPPLLPPPPPQSAFPSSVYSSQGPPLPPPHAFSPQHQHQYQHQHPTTFLPPSFVAPPQLGFGAFPPPSFPARSSAPGLLDILNAGSGSNGSARRPFG